MTLSELVDDLVAVRHAGGYRFKVQERVLRQFAAHCAQQGYPRGAITKKRSRVPLRLSSAGPARSGATRWRYASWPSTLTASAGPPTCPR